MPKRRAKGQDSLFKRGDGYWVGAVELPASDGKRRWKKVVRKDRNEALKALKDLQKARDAGQILSTSSVKMEPYLNDWVERVHKDRVKPSTFPGDRRTVKNHIIPHIGGMRLDRLTPQNVNDMLDAIETTRNKQKAHQMLGLALDTAVKYGQVSRNVARLVDKPKHRAVVHPAFTPHVSLHIIRMAEASSDETWAARWAAGFMTGLRESELLGLEWSRVDFDSDMLDVSWQLQELQKVHGCGEPVGGKYPCGKVRMSFCPGAHWKLPADLDYRECERNLLWTRPKTQRSDRGVPIIAPLKIILQRLRASDGLNPHGLVFHHPDGKPITQSQDQKAWRKLLETAEIPHAPQHTLRRTAATLLRTAQVDEQTRMELFGHASADVQRIYAGAAVELQRQAMGKLADILSIDGGY